MKTQLWLGCITKPTDWSLAWLSTGSAVLVKERFSVFMSISFSFLFFSCFTGCSPDQLNYGILQLECVVWFVQFGGNPVACAMGMAVLEVIDNEKLMSSAKSVGKCLIDGFRGIMPHHPMMGEVRSVSDCQERNKSAATHMLIEVNLLGILLLLLFHCTVGIPVSFSNMPQPVECMKGKKTE